MQDDSKQIESASGKTSHLFDCGVFIDLNEEIARLFSSASVKEESGRNSKMLAKFPEFRIVLVTMRAKSRWDDHKTPSRIFVQVLRGKIQFHTPGRTFQVGCGQLLALDPGILHSVDCKEDSAFLLTLSGAPSQ